jgi:hypothetical protein
MARPVNSINVKNKSVCVVFSWMKAWGIEVRLPERSNEGDLVADGRSVALEEHPSPTSDLTISLSAVLGPDLQVTLAELHRLTEFLGRGKPAGFRNATGLTRASPDDYLGVSMRLTPFSRTPNIPTADVMKWMPTLKKEADRASRRCSGILFNMGLDKNDLLSIGLVYLSNYLCRHQTPGNEKVTGENLTLSLRQQYGRWADVTIRHLKKVAPISAGFPIDFVMGAPCPNSSLEDAHGTDHEASYVFNPEVSEEEPEEEPEFSSSEEEEKWHRRQANKETRYMSRRRRNAQAALELGLSEMGHDRMVEVLREVQTSEFQHPDARDEAKRRLVKHQAACESCRPQ